MSYQELDGNRIMAKQATVTLNLKLETFVTESLANGHYQSESDMLEAGLTLLQSHNQRLDQLRAAIQEGEESGEPREFDRDAFLDRMRQKHVGD
jgi:antitoxin ParD1/3/4